VTLAPGSTPWLLQHEARLYWRGRPKGVGGSAMIVVLLVLLHLLGLMLAWAMSHAPALPANVLAVGLTSAAAALLLLMISRCLVSAVQVLYTRGDFDLLLASPMPARRLIATRATFIAVSVSVEAGVLIWPFANGFALFGHPAWLKAYVLVPTLGLLATSLGLLLTLLLFSLFGPRRTRVIGQVLSGVIAVCFVFAGQIPNLVVGSGHRGAYAAASWQATALSIDGPLFAPARLWLAGNALPVVVLLGGGALLALTIRGFGDRFMSAAIASGGIAARPSRRKASASLHFAGTRRRILVRKELRLIVRDPWLLTQILQQCVAVLPLGVLAWRHGRGGLPLIWAVSIYFCGFLAGALSWITLVAEDAPELLATAPISRDELVRVKLQAALWPILPLVLLPAIALSASHPWFGICISVCAAGSALSCALLNVGDQPTAKRQDFRTRHRGKFLRGLLEMAIVLGWSLLCWALVWIAPGHGR
jgi:ABC-2 type transport system permease protein